MFIFSIIYFEPLYLPPPPSPFSYLGWVLFALLTFSIIIGTFSEDESEKSVSYEYIKIEEKPTSLYPSNWSSIRQNVLERDHYECANCDGYATHVHHIVPLSQGGTNHPNNLKSLCDRCHRRIPKSRT